MDMKNIDNHRGGWHVSPRRKDIKGEDYAFKTLTFTGTGFHHADRDGNFSNLANLKVRIPEDPFVRETSVKVKVWVYLRPGDKRPVYQLVYRVYLFAFEGYPCPVTLSKVFEVLPRKRKFKMRRMPGLGTRSEHPCEGDGPLCLNPALMGLFIGLGLPHSKIRFRFKRFSTEEGFGRHRVMLVATGESTEKDLVFKNRSLKGMLFVDEQVFLALALVICKKRGCRTDFIRIGTFLW